MVHFGPSGLQKSTQEGRNTISKGLLDTVLVDTFCFDSIARQASREACEAVYLRRESGFVPCAYDAEHRRCSAAKAPPVACPGLTVLPYVAPPPAPPPSAASRINARFRNAVAGR